jgi:spore germination cell wall hydrolase CwlJ-like protein
MNRDAVGTPAPPRSGTVSIAATIASIILFVAALSAITVAFGSGTVETGSARQIRRVGRSNAQDVVPPAPAVEPVNFLAMSPDQARTFNAAIPFSDDPNPSAKRFTYVGTPADRENALTCLAAAALYEAGDDPIGQQAVAQVVLNRLRHPAFPKTVCGVVFQGSERKTGCQFTFTCDGSLDRPPVAEAWQRARVTASRALMGYVFKPVGMATHYHTEWVVPYWYNSLDKITEIHTQIFYRWRGWWGLPAAFSRRYQPSETADARIASLLDKTQLPPPSVDPLFDPLLPTPAAVAVPLAVSLPGLLPTTLKKNVLRLADVASNTYVLQLDPSAYPGSYAIVALGICKDLTKCLVLGWTKPDLVPTTFPIQPMKRRSATFIFLRDGAGGADDIRWNCQQVHRDIAAQCLPGTSSEVDVHHDDTVSRRVLLAK